jgi:carboxy-cis,cis-muconate cyclase
MRTSQLTAGLLSLVTTVYSTNHHLFVGSFKSNHLFSLAFDDQSNTLFTEKSFQGHNGHPRLAFNYDKSVLYASEREGWSSYAVGGPTQLDYTNSLELKSRCDGESYGKNRRSQTSLFVSPKYPFMLYGAGRSPCGAVIGVRVDGSLDSIVQNVSFRTTSRIKSQVTDLDGQNLFSADQRGNGIWTHRIDPKTGKLDRGTFTEIPIDNARPAKLALHPAGHYLYVLLQKKNAVALYEVIPRANQIPTLLYATVTFSLLPACKCGDHDKQDSY